jgi:hypothetical protein
VKKASVYNSFKSKEILETTFVLFFDFYDFHLSDNNEFGDF